MKAACLVAATLALSWSGGPRPAVEELKLAPAEGLTLVKTFEVTYESETENSSERGSTSSSSEGERFLTVTDAYESVSDERITKLTRTFDRIESSSENAFEFGGNQQEMSNTGSSDVEDATVVFEWDEDDEEYVAESEDVDDDVLDELPFDLDFTALLPDDEVEEDDEWEIDGETFKTMLSPWEGIPWTYDQSDGESFSDDGDQPEPEIEETVDGEVVVTFAGTRDEDGVTVAIITLEGEIQTDRTIDASREFEQGSSTSHQEVSETRTIEGEALWNLDAGHLHSIEIRYETDATGTMESSFQFGDREFNNESDMEQSGSTKFTASFRVAE